MTLEESLAARADSQVRFLAELVRVPSDNPPGDCAAHAARAAQLLQELGFAVVEARHGREGLERIAEMERVDVVLVDLHMPEMARR